MKFDPDFPEREQRLIQRGWTVAYNVTTRSYHSAQTMLPSLTKCIHYHVRRESAWRCAERRYPHAPASRVR